MNKEMTSLKEIRDCRNSLISCSVSTEFSMHLENYVWFDRRPVIIEGVVPKWKAYQWSREFLYQYYSEEEVLVTEYKVRLFSVKITSEDLDWCDLYQVTRSNLCVSQSLEV